MQYFIVHAGSGNDCRIDLIVNQSMHRTRKLFGRKEKAQSTKTLLKKKKKSVKFDGEILWFRFLHLIYQVKILN